MELQKASGSQLSAAESDSSEVLGSGPASRSLSLRMELLIQTRRQGEWKEANLLAPGEPTTTHLKSDYSKYD